MLTWASLSLLSFPSPSLTLSLSLWPCLCQEEKPKKEAWVEKSLGLEDKGDATAEDEGDATAKDEGDATAEDQIEATAWGKLTWSDYFLLLLLSDLVRSHRIWWFLVLWLPDLVRSHRIWWDLAGSCEISPDLERKWDCVCAWVCCVCDWVLVSNFWQFCFCLWMSLFDMIWLSCKPDKPNRTRPPKLINWPARSDHLNGWSMGWSFVNPTLSSRIENYPQSRTARPEPTPTFT